MKIKSFLLAATLICASSAAMADSYAVWPAAGDGEIQIPNSFNGWYNFNWTEVDGAIKCTPANTDLNTCSSGWMTANNAGFDFGVLADKDLTLDAKVEGTGEWHIRITSLAKEVDFIIQAAADGQFHKQRFNIAKDAPEVASSWASGVDNTRDIFTFSVVGSNLSADAGFYFTNVRYVDAVAMPELTAEAKDITQNSATLTWNASFPEGYTNTSVSVNGEAATGNEMVLSNLTPNTAYTYTIEAKGDIAGETMTATKVVTFKTLREAGKNPVWYGITDKPGFYAEYSITYNDDKTLTVETTLETEKETPAADRNFHILAGGNEWLKLYDNDGDGILSGTTQSTFEDGASITWEWYIPYAGAVYAETNTYVVGSENEKPSSLRINATAGNITFESAEINYDVTSPSATYTVYYRLGEANFAVATASPIALTGLAENTEYTCELYVVSGDIESKHVSVSFKTTRKDAVDLVYADLFAAEFKNAWLPGENPDTDRRSFFVTLPWSVTYRADGTAVYSVELSEVENLVGFVPQIYWNGFQTLTKNANNGLYEYEFGAQTADAVTAISHYFAYNGGSVDVRTPYTNWGMEKEAPVLGEATNLAFSASKDGVMVDEPVTLSAVAKDANNYYLASSNITYTTGDGASINGNKFTATKKGTYTVTAALGDLRQNVTIHVIGTADCTNLASGLKGYTDDANVAAGTVDNVTDADRNSQLEWRCTETEEHFFVLDLGTPYYIHGIDLYFEGAYATEFSLTLSSTRPNEIAETTPVTRRAAAQDVTFTPAANNTQHYFDQDPTGTHQYVTLRTTKALNTGWGIKVRDLKVYGSEKAPSTTSIESVAADTENAPVEYYNLNGMRVDNPENGLYIRRQGSKVTKVLVK